jgi:hypothetical protein
MRPLVVEKLIRNHGLRTAIFDIQNNKMVERACVGEGDNGFAACSPH